MSTSSDNKTPSLSGESAKQVISTTWDELVTVVADTSQEHREAFADWLDEELIRMEAELERFSTSRSRYSGRR